MAAYANAAVPQPRSIEVDVQSASLEWQPLTRSGTAKRLPVLGARAGTQDPACLKAAGYAGGGACGLREGIPGGGAGGFPGGGRRNEAHAEAQRREATTEAASFFSASLRLCVRFSRESGSVGVGEDDRSVAEAGDEVEFAAKGMDQAAEGAELQVVLRFQLRESRLADAHHAGNGGLGEAELFAEFGQEHRLHFFPPCRPGFCRATWAEEGVEVFEGFPFHFVCPYQVSPSFRNWARCSSNSRSASGTKRR